MPSRPSGPNVQVEALQKRFGTIEALRGISLSVAAGEVVAVVGDNAAGKSTLLKIIAGVYRPDAGSIRIAGDETKFGGPRDAQRFHVEMMHQDFALAENLDVAANIYLGRERTLHAFRLVGMIDRRAMREEATAFLSTLGIDAPSATQAVDRLSGGQRQIVALARALIFNPKVLLLDEPTASLGRQPTERCLSLVRSIAERGASTLFVTHRLSDALGVADRIVVLRHGRVQAERAARATSIGELGELISGPMRETR